MKPDALKGVKHVMKEEQFIAAKLLPHGRLAPPESPNSLSIHIYNGDPNHSYIIRISKVVDLVKLPKHK